MRARSPSLTPDLTRISGTLMQPDRIEVPTLRRYLVPFDPKRVPHLFADVLIIGSGIAGTRAALEVDPSLRTIVVTKDRISHSNSSWAQGGIAGVLDPIDKFADHVADTIAAGKGMCDKDVVEFVVHEAPDRIRELIQFGADFDQHNGEIALTLEGGHSHPRVAHALGDATGKEVMRAMHETAFAADNIDIWQQTFTIDLLTCDGICRGALVWNQYHGRTFVWAKQTILATGGAGTIYRETTNPPVATADGHALAFRAGCEVRDMEFMQFHPTVLYIAGSSRHLISEAVRGEGAHLVDCTGYRFMADYSPEMMELAPRDVVSQAITQQMTKTAHPCVYLDLTHIGEEKIRRRFPHIGKVCSDFGLDITTDRVPVRPGAHYMIGGVTTDTEGRTSLPGLWAAGGVTSTGLHGANRLASNSLLEGVVYGLRCGRNASRTALSMPDNFTAPPLISLPGLPHRSDEELDLTDIRNSLRSLMWRNVGISRNERDLNAARQQLDFWANYVCRRDLMEPAGWELQNMMLVGRIMAAAALARQESRGVHLRSDFPETVEAAATHIAVQATD